jgi:hypothetical protein
LESAPDFRLWHFSDMPAPSSNVRVQEQAGSYVLLPSSSQFDPLATLQSGIAAQRVGTAAQLKALGHVDHCSLADHARLIYLKRILLGMEKNAPYMCRVEAD